MAKYINLTGKLVAISRTVPVYYVKLNAKGEKVVKEFVSAWTNIKPNETVDWDIETQANSAKLTPYDKKEHKDLAKVAEEKAVEEKKIVEETRSTLTKRRAENILDQNSRTVLKKLEEQEDKLENGDYKILLDVENEGRNRVPVIAYLKGKMK